MHKSLGYSHRQTFHLSLSLSTKDKWGTTNICLDNQGIDKCDKQTNTRLRKILIIFMTFLPKWLSHSLDIFLNFKKLYFFNEISNKMTSHPYYCIFRQHLIRKFPISNFFNAKIFKKVGFFHCRFVVFLSRQISPHCRFVVDKKFYRQIGKSKFAHHFAAQTMAKWAQNLIVSGFDIQK